MSGTVAGLEPEMNSTASWLWATAAAEQRQQLYHRASHTTPFTRLETHGHDLPTIIDTAAAYQQAGGDFNGVPPGTVLHQAMPPLLPQYSDMVPAEALKLEAPWDLQDKQHVSITTICIH